MYTQNPGAMVSHMMHALELCGNYSATTASYAPVVDAVDWGCTFPYAPQGVIFNGSFLGSAEPVGVASLSFLRIHIQVRSSVIREERTDAPMNVMATESPTATPTPQLLSTETVKMRTFYNAHIHVYCIFIFNCLNVLTWLLHTQILKHFISWLPYNAQYFTNEAFKYENIMKILMKINGNCQQNILAL